MTLGRIVVGAEGAPTSNTLDVAVMLARIGSAPLTVVHTGESGPERDRFLDEAARTAVSAGMPEEMISTVSRSGVPANVIATVAEETDAQTIVVGRGGDRPTHTTHRLSHRSPCDLLVVAGNDGGRAEPYRRLVVATDGSATADRAARRGYDLARVTGGVVELVFVGNLATGAIISRDTVDVYGDGVETDVHLLQGDPTKRILETASAVEADLIVVGNRGLTGLKGVVMASVPRGVLKGASIDVLVVRTVRQIESQLQAGDGGIVERHGEKLAAFRDERGDLHTMSARCTHLGCVVEWNPAASTFDCPCHGSRFSATGEVVNGPAARPLPPV